MRQSLGNYISQPPIWLSGLVLVLSTSLTFASEFGEMQFAGLRERIEQRRAERQETREAKAAASRTLVVNGVTRNYSVHAPTRSEQNKAALPTVFVLHGAKGTAEQVQKSLNLDAVADREGFVTVYPQGIDKTWNDGRDGAGKAVKRANPGDDETFLRELAAQLVQAGISDPKRIYMMGVSNGGFMSLRMACLGASPFAAYAPVIASTPLSSQENCKWQTPLPVLMINGTEDPLVRFDGAPGKFGLSGNFSPPDLAVYFSKLNACSNRKDRALPDRDTRDDSTVMESVWTGCRPGSAVELYAVKGGGHQVPSIGAGRDRWLFDMFLGVRNHDIDTAETVWAFFKRFSK